MPRPIRVRLIDNGQTKRELTLEPDSDGYTIRDQEISPRNQLRKAEFFKKEEEAWLRFDEIVRVA